MIRLSHRTIGGDHRDLDPDQIIRFSTDEPYQMDFDLFWDPEQKRLILVETSGKRLVIRPEVTNKVSIDATF